MQVDVPGGQVFVRRWSGGDAGAPIVLLHDSLGSVEQWRDFPALLAEATQRDVIAYDRLGFGRSSACDALPPITFVEDEVRVFEALRTALGLSRFVVFGHSVGGAMALAIAGSPDCEAVITESAQAFVEARTLDGIRAAQANFTDPAQFAKLERWHGDKARWVLDAWTKVWLSPAFASWSVDASLARIGCPVLALHGERDEFGSIAFPQRIVDGVRDGACIVRAWGHVPHREAPEEIIGLVADFLA